MAIQWLRALAAAYQLEHQYPCGSRTGPDAGLVPSGDRRSRLSRQIGSSPGSRNRGLSIEDDDRSVKAERRGIARCVFVLNLRFSSS